MQALKGIRSLEEIKIADKSVFMRLDLNVPIKDGIIQDDTRIQAALPSIKYALDHKSRLIVASHLGRPKTLEDRQKLSMEPIARKLNELLDVEVILIEEPGSETPKSILKTLKSKQIILLENLRFDPGEIANSEIFTRTICSYIDVYINDAFGASHRAHSSVVGIPTEIEDSGIGFLMKKEITALDKLINSAKPPFAAILGGSKVSDKIDVIDCLIDKVDVFIIGGAMAYTFLKAQGVSVGTSRVEMNKLNFVKKFFERIKTRGKKLLLPIDHIVIPSFNKIKSHRATSGVGIEDKWIAVDIGPQTIELFQKELGLMKTVFWNGPMGVFEKPELCVGTFAVAESLANNKEAFSVVGGGDSAAALRASGYAHQMTHISTGGGASLEYLQGLPLPGLDALRRHKAQ